MTLERGIEIYLMVTLVISVVYIATDFIMEIRRSRKGGTKLYPLIDDRVDENSYWSVAVAFLMIPFMPLGVLLGPAGAVNHAVANIKYYFPGGKARRWQYWERRLHGAAVDDPRYKAWATSEEHICSSVMENYLPSPLSFWFSGLLSVLGLLFWPVTIVLGSVIIGVVMMFVILYTFWQVIVRSNNK